jgi:hypothetical protein
MSQPQVQDKKPVTVKIVLLGKLGVGKSGKGELCFVSHT